MLCSFWPWTRQGHDRLQSQSVEPMIFFVIVMFVRIYNTTRTRVSASVDAEEHLLPTLFIIRCFRMDETRTPRQKQPVVAQARECGMLMWTDVSIYHKCEPTNLCRMEKMRKRPWIRMLLGTWRRQAGCAPRSRAKVDEARLAGNRRQPMDIILSRKRPVAWFARFQHFLGIKSSPMVACDVSGKYEIFW